MQKAVDLFVVYSVIKRLVTPFRKWKAYKYKIIDENGNVLRKRETLQSKEELNAWGYIDIMVANIKKLLSKVPGGSSMFATTAAAILLLRENRGDYSLEEFSRKLGPLVEEVAANNAGSGNVAGIGVGVYGEPGVKKKKRTGTILMSLRRQALGVRNGKEEKPMAIA